MYYEKFLHFFSFNFGQKCIFGKTSEYDNFEIYSHATIKKIYIFMYMLNIVIVNATVNAMVVHNENSYKIVDFRQRKVTTPSENTL